MWTTLFSNLSQITIKAVTIEIHVKGTVMRTEKALINDRVRVLKISWKFRIPTINNFAVIYPWNLLFSYKLAYILTIYIDFSVYE